MAATAILKIAFLAITHRPIVRFRRNFVCGSRTACRQRSQDTNCKFFKSKMADGRHFKNRYIAISLWKIVRFKWNLVHYISYWTRLHSRDQKVKFLKFKMAAAAILKIVFLAITHQPIVGFQRNFVWGRRTACWQKLQDKNCVKSPYLSDKFSDFYEIWYTTSDIEAGYSHVTKIKIFKIKDGGNRHLENRFFGHNSSTDCPISAKFCLRKQKGMPTKATWQKL